MKRFTVLLAFFWATRAVGQPVPDLELTPAQPPSLPSGPTVLAPAPNAASNALSTAQPLPPSPPVLATNEPSLIAVTPLSGIPTASIAPVSTDLFKRLCANTGDPGECGKKIEAEQIKRMGAQSLVRRDGKLLAITVPGEPPFFFEDVESEAGPNTSFYSYSAQADAAVLFRARADKIEYVMVHRPTASITEIPNEPRFNADGRFFVTADFCKEGCENRLAVWRIERRGPARERVFAPRIAWSDVDVSWGSPRRLIVDAFENGKNASINLELSDPRWSVLLP
jgi:hypothetical protein